MRWGIIALTRAALDRAASLQKKLPDAVVYTLPKWRYEEGVVIEGGLADFVGRIFREHPVLVFIMATGIVVRVIAPHIKSKVTDPAVLVVDETGRFVISLLSGHLGGANEAAKLVAEKLGATPVITTASDLKERLAVDMLAKKLNCAIDDMEAAKTVTAMIVNGERVAVISDVDLSLPDYFTDDVSSAAGVIHITSRKVQPAGKPFVRLIPITIVAGVGCKKGTDPAKLIEAIDDALETAGVDRRALRCVASAEIRRDEPAVLEAARHFGAELFFASLAEIAAVESRFGSSDFVREKIGVGAICEPAAYLAAGRSGKMLLPKRKGKGITIALWEEEIHEG